jgi:hypothetical protein
LLRDSQPADYGASDQPLDTPNCGKQGRRDPYQLPVAPLHDARPQADDEVDAANKQQGPVDGEAQDVARIVQVVGLGSAGRQGPVQRRELGGRVARWGSAVEALDEAGADVSNGRGDDGYAQPTSFDRHDFARAPKGWGGVRDVRDVVGSWRVR